MDQKIDLKITKVLPLAIALSLAWALLLPEQKVFADYDVPSYDEGLNRMGHRDFDGAILTFNQAIGANSRNAKAYWKRGQCFYYLQNYKLAIDDFSAAIGVDPKNAEFYLWRGATHCKAGDDPHSIMDYEEALRVDPSLLKAVSGAEAKPQDGTQSPMFAKNNPSPSGKSVQNEKSIQNYMAAAKIVNEGSKPTFVAGNVFAGITRPEYPEDQNSAFLKPDGLDKIKANPKETVDACRKALASNPREANEHFRFALALQLQTGKTQKALDEFADAISQEPNNTQFLLARAYLHHLNHNDAAAKMDIEKARLIDPKIPANLSF